MGVVRSLVLVDKNPRSRAAIMLGFEREGCKVRATGDPSAALAIATVERPQLLVASSLDSHTDMDPVGFVRSLRATQAGSELPVMVIGSADEQARAKMFAAGVDEYLPRPAFIRDVVTLGKLTVAMRREGGACEGDLAEYRLYFMARALHAARRSALLVLERDGRSGELRFRDGELVSARIGRLGGASAFLHLILWDRARFWLRFATTSLPTPLSLSDNDRKFERSTRELLDEGQDLATAFEACATRIGGANTIFLCDPQRLEEMRSSIPPEVLPLAPCYDGQRPLIDIIEESPFKPLDTIAITQRLAELHVIRPQEAAERSVVSAALRALGPRITPTNLDPGRYVVQSPTVLVSEAREGDANGPRRPTPTPVGVTMRPFAHAIPVESVPGQGAQAGMPPPPPPPRVTPTSATRLAAGTRAEARTTPPPAPPAPSAPPEPRPVETSPAPRPPARESLRVGEFEDALLTWPQEPEGLATVGAELFGEDGDGKGVSRRDSTLRYWAVGGGPQAVAPALIAPATTSKK
jgi:DNA-binding response OmpR family regulator